MKRRGYILLMVLGVLLIAGLMSAGVARRSIVLTRTAALQEAELQRRFARLSARQAILERAEIILKTEEVRLKAPVPVLQRSFLFHGAEVTILLADEQTKINLNSVAQIGHLPAVYRIAAQSSDGLGSDVPILLRPDPVAVRGESHTPWFSSWSQVYDMTDAVRRSGYSSQMVNPVLWSEQTTCWGTGELNLRRTPTDRLKRFLSLILPPEKTKSVIQALAKNPTWKTERLLRDTDLTSNERRTLREYLTDRSRCYSFWYLSQEPNRTYYRMTVKTPDGTQEVWRQ